MHTTKEQIKEMVAGAVKGASWGEVDFDIEYPDVADFGDYSTNAAMKLAKQLGRAPRDVADELVGHLKKGDKDDLFEKIEVAGPGFVNFYLKEDYLQGLLGSVLEQGSGWSVSEEGKGKTVLVEYSSPNTNKPLHLGHMRNNFLGVALGNILKSRGYKVLMTELVNDRGVHICKSMLAYKLWGDGDTPEKSGMKGDHFVGKYYVLYNQKEKKDPKLADQAQEMLRKWEDGDEETRKLWRKMNDWAEEGYKVTYDRMGSEFDFRYYESDIYDKGKDVVLKALEDGHVEKIDGGAVAVDLSKYNLGGRDDGKKVLIRSDGTAMYITQDIYLAVKRWEEYEPDKMLYVVGDEQIYHFQVLFKILEILGYEWARDRYFHVFYGHVNLPEGRMKSREGTVVDADDLLDELEAMAREEIVKRIASPESPLGEGERPPLDPPLRKCGSVSEDEIARRSDAVALAAIKFYLLKVDAKSTMMYDPKASLDFAGNTGPYLQYTYARLSSILAKAGNADLPRSTQKDPPLTPPLVRVGDESGHKMLGQERRMLVLLGRYEEVVKLSADSFRPHYLAEYLFELASAINSWYVDVPVLKAEGNEREWRLVLVAGMRTVLRSGLELLGIEVLEKM